MALQSQHTLAVLDDAGMLAINYRTRTHAMVAGVDLPPCEGLHSLWEICHKGEIETLWLTPGSFFSREVQQLIENTRNLDISEKSSRKQDGTPLFLLVTRPGSPHKAKLAWPEYDDRWPFRKCLTASTLLDALRILQDAIEAPVEWGPGRVGQKLMLQLNERHAQWFEPLQLPETVTDHIAVDMHWKRPLTAAEKKSSMWIHFFDKDSAYLGACTGARLGEGQPEYLEDPTGNITFDPRVPGLWHIFDRWIWTPEAEYLRACEAKMDPDYIDAAYIWPKHHQLLRSWGEHMWEARCALKLGMTQDSEGNGFANANAYRLAYEANKSIYTQGLGWLNFNRPDWWAQIVATQLRNVGFKKRQLELAGLIPCYWNVDMLGVVTDSRSLAPFQENILNRAGRLGGYKHVKSVRMNSQRAAVFVKDAPFKFAQDAILAWGDD